MGQRETGRRGPQRHPEPRAGLLQAPGPDDQRVRRRLIVVGGAGFRSYQQAGVEHSPGDDRHAAPLRGRQQRVRRGPVEQGVAACHQHDVDVGFGDEPGQHLGLVHPDADRADHPCCPQLLQRRVRLAECLLTVVVRVVDERDVDAVQAEPAQARLQAAPDAVRAEVEPPDLGRRDVEARGVTGRPGPAGAGGRGRPGGLEEAADLGGEHVLVSRTVPQGVAQTALGQAEAVVRRGVERADAAVPRRVDRGCGVVVAHRGEQVPDRRAAEGQLGDLDRRAAEAPPRQHDVHCPPPVAAGASRLGSVPESAKLAGVTALVANGSDQCGRRCLMSSLTGLGGASGVFP